MLVNIPSHPQLCRLVLSVWLGARAEGPRATSSEVEGPGCGWCTVPPSLIGGDLQPFLEKGTHRGKWGLASETIPV